MSQLQVYKQDGSLLFDTNYITYGLVKSGYMTFFHYWNRKTLLSAQLDPNNGANWTTTSATTDPRNADAIFGFTVYNAISPIVFLVGAGCLVGSAVSGSTITFYYANTSTSTKYYCFDLMADNIAGSPFLKTYNTAGQCTFNSLQPPLNIIGGVQAPSQGALDQYGRPKTTYAGGANVIRQSTPTQQVDSYVNIALGAAEYAAYLPWSRSCGTFDFLSGGGAQYGMSEGAYGYYGGIAFMFGAAAGTTNSRPSTVGWSAPISFFNLPLDRFPVALVITTAGLPFPYN